MSVVSRKEALALGLTRYFTGKPCPKGHVAERKTSSGSCVVCNAKSVLRSRARNLESERRRKAKWRDDNREHYNKYFSAYWANNPHILARRRVLRRVGIKDATPSWSTGEMDSQIAAVYDLARDCAVTAGESYHVDHIVPLRGGNVCGLHVPWNLQVLPSDINIAKGNKHG